MLRYASADRMRAASVGCHNSHPDSPRRGWRVGDVRGVLEISRPLAASEALARAQLVPPFILMMVLLTLLLLLLNVVLRRLHTSLELAEHHAEELARAKDLAEQASRAKSLFLANVSHELRTPLNAILGYSQILRRNTSAAGAAPAAGDGGSMLQSIESAGQHLLALINAILERSRPETGAAASAVVDFDPTALAEAARARAEADRNGESSAPANLSEQSPPHFEIPPELYQRLQDAVAQSWITGIESGLVELAQCGTAGAQAAAHLDGYLRDYDLAGLGQELQSLAERPKP